LTVVIEPTGPMWLPIAVYFGRRGHTVVRVSSAQAADLRRFLSRHAKATASMRTRWRGCRWWPAGLPPVELGGAERASLDRRVRTVARLTREIGQRKVRIRALAQTLIPTIGHALGDGLNRTDLAVLERYADPRALLGAGRTRLARLVRTESRGKLSDDKVRALRTAAEQALQLWGDDPPSRCPTWSRRSPQRSGCCAWPKPNALIMKQPGTPRWPRRSAGIGHQPARPGPGRSHPTASGNGKTRSIPQRRGV
jgi:hypothetical protein